MALTERDWQKISGWAFVIGPLQFAVATLVEGALIPGYGLITHWISDLGAPPNNAPHFAPGTSLWWVFSVSLTLMSLLIFVGMVGFGPLLWNRVLGKITLVILAVVALGAIGVAVFNEVDALELHSISALIAFGSGWAALVLFGVYARDAPRWKGWWWPLSILGGLVSLVALVLYVVPTSVGRTNVPSWVASVYPGGSERLIVLPLILWLVAIGVQLIRGFEDTRSPRPEPVAGSSN
ncbi:MAG: DUF998 domain-containing protein [Thermoplasmata archaeon]|nr:DUF998 domain-containing protein [Thermoplasmata archaeon]